MIPTTFQNTDKNQSLMKSDMGAYRLQSHTKHQSLSIDSSYHLRTTWQQETFTTAELLLETQVGRVD